MCSSLYAGCLRSSDQFYILRYFIKWVTTYGHIIESRSVAVNQFNQFINTHWWPKKNKLYMKPCPVFMVTIFFLHEKGQHFSDMQFVVISKYEATMQYYPEDTLYVTQIYCHKLHTHRGHCEASPPTFEVHFSPSASYMLW